MDPAVTPPGPPPGRPAAPPLTLRRARTAVGVLFLANGALYANLVPRYPDLKDGLGLSNAAFGAAVAGYGVGALVLGLVAGAVVARWGSARVAPVCSLVAAATVVLVALAPSWAALAVVFALSGALDAVGDVASNAHGLRVERAYRRPVLNGFHALWSIGAVAGGVAGSAAAGVGLPVLWHLVVAGSVLSAGVLTASRWLLPGPDDVPTAHAGAAAHAEPPSAVHPGPAVHAEERAGRPGRRLLLVRSVAALGAVAAAAQVMEEVTATWGALYLRGELGATALVGGLGFTVLQGAQTLGRLVGDRLVGRFGDRAVALAGAALAAAAMAAALALPGAVGPAGTVVAFGLVGLGIGTLIPASMRTADALPGLRPGSGLTLVGSVLRLSLLLSPLVIGVVADAASLRAGLLLMPLAALVVLVLSRALPAGAARAPAGVTS